MSIFIVTMCLMMMNVFSEGNSATQANPLITIKLPKVRINGGKSLMEALKNRKSSRDFSDKELPQQVLSDLLWAAFGVNRPDSGGRTAPSAHNMQEMDIFVSTREGLYFYEPKQHILKMVSKKDIRNITGKQDFVGVAPVNLIYVADYSRMGKVGMEKDLYSAIDAGFIAQNVYLYCASRGLGVVARTWLDKEALGKAMSLRPEQRVILAQTVGYRK